MSLLRVRTYPDPVLRVRCSEVEQFDDELKRLAADMVETMYGAPGVGLAAPQVGVPARMTVVDVTVGEEDGGLLELVNPVILEDTGSERELEGCLSIPGLTEKVDRASWIRVRAQDLDGRSFEFEAEDFLARAISHEIDHLDGVLFVDRLRGLRREKAKRYLRKLKEEELVTA